MQEVEVEGGKRSSSLPCPRCDSMDTKFCYYNNYNTSQPRHFCKNCKRYWTAGGSLRNVPVGGNLRKNKKSRTSSSSSSSSSAKHSSPDTHSPSAPHRPANAHNPNPNPNPNPNLPFLLHPPNPNPNPSPSSSSAERDFDPPAFPAINGLPFPPHLASFHYPSSSDLPPFDETHLNPTPHFHASSHHFNYLDPRSSYYGYHPSSGEFFHHAAAAAPHDGFGFLGKKDPAHSSSLLLGGSDQACSGGAMENDPQSRLNAHSRLSGEANGDAAHGQGGLFQASRDGDASQCSGNSYGAEKAAEHGGFRDKPRADEEDEEAEEEYDDDLEDVVNVRYPFDWEQVSEVLFGGTPDFVYLPGR